MADLTFAYCPLCEARDVEEHEARSCPEAECPVRDQVSLTYRVSSLAATLRQIGQEAQGAQSAGEDEMRRVLRRIVSLVDEGQVAVP